MYGLYEMGTITYLVCVFSVNIKVAWFIIHVLLDPVLDVLNSVSNAQAQPMYLIKNVTEECL